MKAKTFFIATLLLSSQLYAGNGDKTKTSTYKVNTTDSKIEWSGKKVGGGHYGNIEIKEGNVVFDGKTLKGGTFTMDMNSITCTDLTDQNSNGKLVDHLKSDDFFGVDKHPASTLAIKKVDQKSNNEYEITSDLTIKGITHEVVFPATVREADGKITANADITVDRTKYDIKFRSGRFFDSLGDKLIYDDFTLKVSLVANQDVL